MKTLKLALISAVVLCMSSCATQEEVAPDLSLQAVNVSLDGVQMGTEDDDDPTPPELPDGN